MQLYDPELHVSTCVCVGSRVAKCRLGTYYERIPGGGRSLFAEGESIKGTELLELKVQLYASIERLLNSYF